MSYLRYFILLGLLGYQKHQVQIFPFLSCRGSKIAKARCAPTPLGPPPPHIEIG